MAAAPTAFLKQSCLPLAVSKVQKPHHSESREVFSLQNADCVQVSEVRDWYTVYVSAYVFFSLHTSYL